MRLGARSSAQGGRRGTRGTMPWWPGATAGGHRREPRPGAKAERRRLGPAPGSRPRRLGSARCTWPGSRAPAPAPAPGPRPATPDAPSTRCPGDCDALPSICVASTTHRPSICPAPLRPAWAGPRPAEHTQRPPRDDHANITRTSSPADSAAELPRPRGGHVSRARRRPTRARCGSVSAGPGIDKRTRRCPRSLPACLAPAHAARKHTGPPRLAQRTHANARMRTRAHAPTRTRLHPRAD